MGTKQLNNEIPAIRGLISTGSRAFSDQNADAARPKPSQTQDQSAMQQGNPGDPTGIPQEPP